MISDDTDKSWHSIWMHLVSLGIQISDIMNHISQPVTGVRVDAVPRFCSWLRYNVGTDVELSIVMEGYPNSCMVKHGQSQLQMDDD